MNLITERFWMLFLLIGLLGTATASAELLDGTRWKVQVIPDHDAHAAGATTYAEELVFANGKFTANGAVAKGFKAAEYTSEDEGYEIEFEAVLTSETEGTATWWGGVANKKLTGKLECIKKDGSKLYFILEGTRL